MYMGVIQDHLHVHVMFVREFHVMILSLVCIEQLAPNLRQVHPSEDAGRVHQVPFMQITMSKIQVFVILDW